MKNTYAASIAIAIAALSAGHAMAGDGADLVNDFTGMSARQMFPARYGVEVASGKTRAEVKAELIAFNRSRDGADLKMDLTGMSARQMFPAQYGVAVTSGKTRAEVKAELADFRSNRDGADEVMADIGMSAREMFPSHFVKANRTNTGSNFAGL